MVTTRRSALIVGLLLAGVAVPATAQTRDFNPTYSTLENRGSSSNRVDMVFIGDGYQANELGTKYVSHINGVLDDMFGKRLNDPFPRYTNFFNVHRVNVVSQQSGADRSRLEETVDTALDASYKYDTQTDRLLYFSSSLANAAVSTALQGTGIVPDMRLGVVNDTKYGGGGGQWAVWAGGNSSAREVAIHELGHSFAGLADEYDYPNDTYTPGNVDPFEVNVSIDPTGANKWSQWLGYDDPYHNGQNGTVNISKVGAYEGARYYKNGLYRPTGDSKMRNLNKPFNAVSREEIILDIYKFVDPLDAFLDNTTALFDPDSLWVDTVDPDVIEVDWLVDGVLRLDDGPENLNLDLLDLDPGVYTITAASYDRVLDLANTGLDLDWVRRDGDKLRQDVSWQVTLVPEPTTATLLLTAGGLLLRRRQTRRQRQRHRDQ